MATSPRVRSTVTFSDFAPTDYPGLNGPRRLVATKLEIEKSLLMVGYPSATQCLAAVGPWRAQLLSALVKGYLTGRLASSSYFRALEPSERVSMTFLLAQAFTHWAAQRHLGVPVLLHVKGAAPRWTLAAMSAPAKRGAGQLKKKGRPDFIGIAGNEFHVFESKGRSLPSGSSSTTGSTANGCLPSALAQVSRIATVNGLPPKTRTAAVWVVRDTGTFGYLNDPPAMTDALHLEFNLEKALTNYYRLALDLAEEADREVGIQFIRFPISEERTLVVDRKLLALVQGLADQVYTARDVFAHLERRSDLYERLRSRTRASMRFVLGPDGVGLLGSSAPTDPDEIELWLK